MLQGIKIPPLQDRRKANRLIFFYKVVEGLVPALQSSDYLTPVRTSKRKCKMTPQTGNFGLILLLWIIPYSYQNLNLYLDDKETSRLLGIQDSELYYVRNGILNKYALTFIMPIPLHIDSIFFTWQNLRSKPPDMFYKMRFKVFNPTAMDMPIPSIETDGKVPTEISKFRITFRCTGALTTEVDVHIQMNISIFSASNVTVLNLKRKKMCNK
ncbi:hypothetical protein DPMN_138658, partial [Dreissena polymorpha]